VREKEGEKEKWENSRRERRKKFKFFWDGTDEKSDAKGSQTTDSSRLFRVERSKGRWTES